MKEYFFEKNEKMYFWQKPEGVILHDGNFDSTKSSPHTCLDLGGRMVFVSIFRHKKNQLRIGKKWENFRKIFSLLYLQKKSRAKKISKLQRPRKINETMNPIFGLGHEIFELNSKKTRIFFNKN